MDSKNDKSAFVNEKLYEIEKSVSLCTLCVLETRDDDSDEKSPSVSPVLTSISESIFGSLKHDELSSIDKVLGKSNYVSQFDERAIFDKITNKYTTIENNFFHSRNNAQIQNNNNYSDYTLFTSMFDDDDDNITADLSFVNLLKSLDHDLDTVNDGQTLDKLSQEVNRENQSENSIISSGSETLSLEIGMAPKISQSVIENIINSTDDGNLINKREEIEELFKSDEIEPKEQISTSGIDKNMKDNDINVANNENSVSTMNPMLEPIRCYESGILDDEIPRKKWKFDVAEYSDESSMKKSLKRDKINESTETSVNIPRKKPKIIANELLEFPVQNNILLKREKIICTINDSGDIAKNDNCLVDTDDFSTSATKRSKIPNGTFESINNEFASKEADNQRQLRRNDEIRKINNGNEETAKNVESKNANATSATNPSGNSRNPPKHPPLHSKAAMPRPPLNLLMLQRKIAENSKHLIEQAKEMRKLSSFIDELRQDFSGEDIKVEKSGKVAKKLKKEFVSRGTQTTDLKLEIPNNSTFKVPSVVNIEATKLKPKTMRNNENNIETTIERSVFDHGWFRPTASTNPNNERKIVANDGEMRSERHISKDFEIQGSGMVTKKMENWEKENSSVQYDPYYNPLRPRRWPNNRNNSKLSRVGQSRDALRKFPPLPVIVETPICKKKAK